MFKNQVLSLGNADKNSVSISLPKGAKLEEVLILKNEIVACLLIDDVSFDSSQFLLQVILLDNGEMAEYEEGPEFKYGGVYLHANSTKTLYYRLVRK